MLSPLLTQREAAEILGISVRSLERMRVTGLGLRFVKVGASVRYQPGCLGALDHGALAGFDQ